MYSFLQVTLCLSLLGFGFGKPFTSQIENPRMKRQIAGYPSLGEFELNKAVLHTAGDILKIKFCKDDHLAGVVCPGEEESDNPSCASWDEVCNGRQFCGVDEYNRCIAKTINDYGVPWFDFCRAEDKVDYCRLKEFQPIRCGSDIKLRTFSTRETKITSPGYDRDYNNNVFCFWRVTAPEGSSIKISFKSFATEKNFDYVNIGRGSDYLTNRASQLILNKFSGPSLPDPAEFVIHTDEIFVSFVSDAYDNEKGFRIGLSIAKENDTTDEVVSKEATLNEDCGAPGVIKLVDGSHFNVTSPNFPGTYSPNSQCDWKFKVPSGRRIGIRVIHLDTEYQTDVITIGYGTDVGSRDSIVTRLEGNNIPKKPVVVKNENAWLRFTTDTAIERTGFRLEVSEIPASGCGGQFTVPVGGSVVVATTNFPDLAYRLNQHCEWRFKSEGGRKLTMQFLTFKTQQYADVVNAGYNDEPAFDWSNYVITEHSGDGLPDPPAFDSKKKSVWLSFRSDSFIVDRGFKVLVGDTRRFASGVKAVRGKKRRLNEDCGEEYSREEVTSEIVISSPEKGGYPPLLNCIWLVDIPFGGHVKIQWDQFLTEANHDFVTLGNGTNPLLKSSVLLDKHSGLRAPDEIDGIFQSVWIRFQTDLRNNYRGWQLRIIPVPYTECGGLLKIPKGGSMAIASPGYPNNYPSSMTCRYTIQSTSGTRIIFTITKFDTSYEDYLSVGEGCSPNDGGDIILEKQAVTKPFNYQFIPRTAAVWMKFSTDKYRNRPGWMINIADTGLAVDGEERGFSTCDQYTSDDISVPAPEPTSAVEVTEEEVTHGNSSVTVEEITVDFPDWYDDSIHEEKATNSTVAPIHNTTAV